MFYFLVFYLDISIESFFQKGKLALKRLSSAPFKDVFSPVKTMFLFSAITACHSFSAPCLNVTKPIL